MEESVFMDGVRGVMATIDRAVYGLISVFYDTIITLSDITIIGSDKISEITNKVYALIAVFMIFKISFSLINYLVNPDMIVDKAKGGGALVKNVIITFILVITVPFGFDLLYRAQSAILSDGIIEKLIYGGETVNQGISFKMDDDYCESTSATAGDYVGLMAFKTFFQIDEQSLETYSGDFYNGNPSVKEMYCSASVNGGKASVNNLLKNNRVYSAPHGFSTQHYYVVDYSFFLSTIVGIVLALVFLGFCFDVATRSIKLQFLEILAPIPIISYIDPDKSKSGMFSKWIKEVATTWLSLFMRLIAYYIAIYFISTLHENASLSNNLWINLLIIIGILMFAKELPKLLENIIGIKASGSFNLNPLKKINDNALGGKLITGAAIGGAGLAAGGLAQSASNMYAFGRDRQALAKAIASETDAAKKAKLQAQYDRMGTARFLQTASGGLVGGARRGAVSGYKSGQGGSANVFKNLQADLKSGNTARNNRTSIRNFNQELKRQRDSGLITDDAYNEQRYGWFERNITENIDKASGVKNEYGGYGYYDKQISKLDRDIENNQQQEEALRVAAANYCANKGLDFSTLYNDYMKNGTLPTDARLATQFAGIKKLDDDTKQKRADKKGFQEMLNARQSVKNDK